MFEYTPIDAYGAVIPEAGACRRFITKEYALEYAHAMSLRYPFYRIEKVPFWKKVARNDG